MSRGLLTFPPGVCQPAGARCAQKARRQKMKTVKGFSKIVAMVGAVALGLTLSA